MHLTQHLVLSWLLPGTALHERRDRILVVLAGLAPDVDAPILLAMGRDAFVEHHHDWTHHLAGAAVAVAAGAVFGKRRALTAAFAGLAWCLHLVFDLIGAGTRDPATGAFVYSLPLLWPWSDRPFDPFPFAWPLDGWPNFVIMAFALALAGWMGVRYGRTPVEVFSTRADRAVVRALRARFGGGRDAPPESASDRLDAP